MKKEHQQRQRRSRGGCWRCKDLHIKCDEALPVCSHCRQGRKKCRRGVRPFWPGETSRQGVGTSNVRNLHGNDLNRSQQQDYHSQGEAFAGPSPHESNTIADSTNASSALDQSSRAATSQNFFTGRTPLYFIHTEREDFETIHDPNGASKLHILSARDHDDKTSWKNAYTRIVNRMDESSATMAILGPVYPPCESTCAFPVTNFGVPAFPMLHEPSSELCIMVKTESDRLLLDYYMKVVSPCLAVAGSSANGFHNIVLPLSSQHQPLLQALIALAANHIQPLEPMYYKQMSDLHKHKALLRLSESLRLEGVDALVPNLVTLLMLCYHEIVDECQPSWTDRLELARRLVDQMRPQKSHSEATNFCLRMFSYFDIAARSACRESALFKENDGDREESTSSAEAQRIDPILGCSPELMMIVSSITDIARYKSSQDGTKDNQLISKKGAALLRRVDNIPQWTSESSTEVANGLIMTAEAKRKAALIMIAAAIQDVRVDKGKLKRLVHQTLFQIESIARNGSYIRPALLWPLFVAGCEAEEESSRFLTLRLFDVLEDHLSFRHIRRSRSIVATVWKKRDILRSCTPEDDRKWTNKGNDWATVVQPLCWKLSLV